MSETGDALDLGDPLRAGVFFVTATDIAVLEGIARDAGLLARAVDLRGCVDKQALLARLAQALDVPDDRGRNWDALADALRDLAWLPAPGYVLLLEDGHDLRDADEGVFDTLLGILDEAAAEWTTREIPFWAFLALPDSDFESDG